MFDWNLEYRQLRRLPHQSNDETTPYSIPIMTGGVFLIRKNYFFELGPYDEGLLIWGAENLEMSFKLHLCGGNLIEVPCSRMGHLYRMFNKFRKHPTRKDFTFYNKKRVVEVWMDEYKKYVYNRNPTYYQIDPGDLTQPLAVKEKLNCKPFKHFIDFVVPDLNEHYPPEILNFANGTVQLLNTNYCLDTYSRPLDNPIGLYLCEDGAEMTQYFELTWYRDIRIKYPEICLDAKNAVLSECHYMFGNQLFKYDMVSTSESNLISNYQNFYCFPQVSHQIINLNGKPKCLEGNVKQKTVVLNNCDKSNMRQKWKWESLNMTMLMSWKKFGKKLP